MLSSLTNLKPKRPKTKRGPLATAIELGATVLVAVGIALLVQAFLVKPYQIPSGSMENTLVPGQRILVNRLNTHPGLGDIVVFHPPVSANYEGADECAAPHESPAVSSDEACDQTATVASSQTFVKRVVGLPGDRLTIRDGYVYRNGKKETGSYINTSHCPDSECTLTKQITIPAGTYYMMGDNRGDSEDSRYWGPEPQKWVIGVAIATYWPLGRLGFF